MNIMRIQKPIPHWNNFTIPELKEILEHCTELERLGIAQDEEMMISIKRDITLRERIIDKHYLTSKSKLTQIEHQKETHEYIIEQTI